LGKSLLYSERQQKAGQLIGVHGEGLMDRELEEGSKALHFLTSHQQVSSNDRSTCEER